MRARARAWASRVVRAVSDHENVLLLARLVCSDLECLASVEEAAETLAELEALACDCGCGLEVVAISEVELV